MTRRLWPIPAKGPTPDMVGRVAADFAERRGGGVIGRGFPVSMSEWRSREFRDRPAGAPAQGNPQGGSA